MSHTVTKTTGWMERLGSSFGGMAFGLVLLAIGTMLLWWNEGRFVKTRTALNEAQNVTRELENIGKVDTANNGQLVHAIGPVETKDILEDPFFGISTNAIRLERIVEYYQWVEDKKTETKTKLGGGEEEVTTYNYAREWVASPVDSSRFASPQKYQNTVIVGIENFTAQASDVTFGAYRLPEFLVNLIGGSEPFNVELSDDVITKLDRQLAPSDSPPIPPPSSVSPEESIAVNTIITMAGTETVNAEPAPVSPSDSQQLLVMPEPSRMLHSSGNTLYLGFSPEAPHTGDVRVTFKHILPTTVSLIAKLNHDTFEAYHTKNGKSISMLSVGTHSQENMYGSAHAGNSTMTWILRIVGIIFVCFGLGQVTAPLKTFADVVPFLGNLIGAGTGVFCMLLGAAWSFLVIAVAWLFYRPLIGILLLVGAAAIIMLLYTRGRSGKAGDTQPGGTESA